MRIYVRTLQECLIDFQVSQDCTFLQLKELIGTSQGFPPEDVSILFTEDYSDNDTLESKGITEDSLVRFGVVWHGRFHDWKQKIAKFFWR